MPTNNRQRDIKRLVLGVLLSFCLGLFIAWPMAYLSTIGVCILLTARKPITISMAVIVILIIVVIVNIFYGLFSWFGQYNLMLLSVLFIFCYLIFYISATGGAKIITLTALMAALIIPTSYNFSSEMAWLVTKWLPINVFISFLVASFFLALIPLSDDAEVVDDNLNFTPEQAHARALELSAGVLLFVTIFWSQGWTDILMLVFLTLFVHRLVECPSLRYKVTLGYLAANVVGGALAVVSFQLLVAATNPIFFVLLSALVFSVLSLKAFTDEQKTTLTATAMNAFVALMGTSVLYYQVDAEVPYITRLSQIVAIAVYLLLFFAIYDWLKQRLIEPSRHFKMKLKREST